MNINMTDEHKEKLKLARERAKALKDGKKPVATERTGTVSKAEDTDMMSVLKELAGAVGSINKRLTRIETGDRDAFMEAAKPEDVAKAGLTRKGVDPRILEIVNKTLGEDFGVEIGTFKDRPGYLFTVVVPPRLSDAQASEKPVLDLSTGKYKQRLDGQGVETETYYPEDRRSRALSSEQSFDAIKEHCERVRSYIVAYYQKLNKPLPEFRLK